MAGKHCFLTCQEDGGQILVWPKGKNEELVEKQWLWGC